MTPRALKDVLLAKTEARLASTTMADEEGDERMAGDSEESDGASGGASDGASDGESDEMEPPSPTRSVAGRAPVRP